MKNAKNRSGAKGAVMTAATTVPYADVQKRIVCVRDQPVIIDADVAELYGVQVKRLNEQVRRNIERFPESFMFQLTSSEIGDLKSQIATSSSDGGMMRLKSQIATSSWGGVRKPPKVFTEKGLWLFPVIREKKRLKPQPSIEAAFLNLQSRTSKTGEAVPFGGLFHFAGHTGTRIGFMN